MKRHFEKIFAEFEKLFDKNQVPKFYMEDFEQLIDLMISDDETLYRGYDRVPGWHGSFVNLCYAAYKFGYVSAIRKMKALEKKGQKTNGV